MSLCFVHSYLDLRVVGLHLCRIFLFNFEQIFLFNFDQGIVTEAAKGQLHAPNCKSDDI